MTYRTELRTYIGTLDDTIDNLGTMGAKLNDFADTADQAASVVETIDDIGDKAEKARGYIDDELRILKLTKLAGPLKTPSKVYEKVLLSIRPVVDEIAKAVDKLNGKTEKGGDGEEEEGDFLEKLKDFFEDTRDTLNDIGEELETKARELHEVRETSQEYLDALDHADFAAYDDLKLALEAQFAGRNAVTKPLGDLFNDITSKINATLGLFSDAEFELVEEDFGDFSEVVDAMGKIAEPLSVAASVLKPVEGILDAVGFAVDLVLGPIFEFITKTLGLDKLLGKVSDEIRSLMPDADFLDPLIASVDDLLADMREFANTRFGLGDIDVEIDERLLGGFIGDALLGPTGYGTASGESLYGDGGDDILDAREGNDEIWGGLGNDIIVAGEGDDIAYGGAGEDMVFFDGFFNEYELAKEDEDGRVIVTHVRPREGYENEGSTLLDSIEHVVFRNIAFTGEELENAIIGGSTLNGTNLDDLMFLNSTGTTNGDGQHVANGRGGDDRIFGSTGDDELNGGNGHDILLPGLGDDEANGDGGIDTYQVLDGSSNSPHRIDLVAGTAFGPEGRERLNSIENLIIQSGGDHRLSGDAGANNILSADGDDIVTGREGDDFINSGEGNDLIVAGAGVDTVLAGDGRDIIFAMQPSVVSGTQIFDGGEGGDTLSYSQDKNAYEDFFYVDVSISPDVRNIVGEVESPTGHVRINSRTGVVRRFDEDGKLLGLDTAVDIENFIGSDNGDVIYGADVSSDGFIWGSDISVHGAGGDDVIFAGGSQSVYGGSGDDLIRLTRGSESGRLTTIIDGGGGHDTLDLRDAGDARWSFRLEGSISRGIRAYDADYAGDIQRSGASGSIKGIDEYILNHGDDYVYFREEHSSPTTFRLMGGDDVVHSWGGYGIFHAGAGDDWVEFREGGEFYGGFGDDFASFDDTTDTNVGMGGQGNDTFLLKRFFGTLDGGAGFDTVTLDLDRSSAYASAYTTVDLAAGTVYLYAKRAIGNNSPELVDATLAGFEQVIGSEYDDTISGAGANEKLIGRLGADVLDGRDGDDQLFGGAGNDRLLGGAGNDRLHGGAGSNTLDGGAGRDAAVYTYAAPDGKDGAITAGNFGGVTVDLRAGTASGGFGSDTLTSIEDAFGTASADVLRGSGKQNILSGEGGDDLLDGRAGRDVLITGSGDNTALGGGGADRIIVGTGHNTVRGGKGTDTLTFGPELGSLTVDFGRGTYSGRFQVSTPVWLDTGTSETRSFNGQDLTPEDVKQSRALFADSADDLSRVLPDADDALAQDFRIREATTRDKISGTFKGIEKIEGGAAEVRLVLGTGKDVYDGSNSSRDIVDFSTYGVDIEFNLRTGASNQATAAGDRLKNVEGLVGGRGDDGLIGTGGKNLLWGGRGGDDLKGAAGNDKLWGGGGGDGLSGDAGRDLLKGQAGHDKLWGGKDNDTLWGGSGNDALSGNEGRDRLQGQAGKDTLNGGDGHDILSGGKGRDALRGGAGADEFRFASGDGKDRVLDFQDDRDVLNLKSWDFASRKEAMSHASRSGDHVLFDFGDGDTVLVRNMTKSDLMDDLLV